MNPPSDIPAGAAAPWHSLRRRIRVAYVIATLERGGSERQMAELAARLPRDEFEAEVFCLTRGGVTAEVLDAARVPYRVLGKRCKIDLRPILTLAAEFTLRPPTVIHTWLFTSNLFGRLAGLKAGNTRIIVSERSTDPWKSRAHRAADIALLPATARVVANSASVAESLVENGIPRAKVVTIPNGVDMDRFRPRDSGAARAALGLDPDGKYFGFIGRLAYEKRPELFLAAAVAVTKAVPGARAVFFGPGPMEAMLRERAAGAANIIFYGDCPVCEIAHAALDCVVITSAWEGFPNVVVEAMACARPVVSVRLPSTEEIIRDRETGILVDDDVNSIAAAVIEVLTDAKLAAKLGRKGREEAASLYSMDKMVERYAALYREVARPSDER